MSNAPPWSFVPASNSVARAVRIANRIRHLSGNRISGNRIAVRHVGSLRTLSACHRLPLGRQSLGVQPPKRQL
jgi:hypothetical protein